MNRTLREIARNALLVQSACNLSGVVHSWSQDIAELRELLGWPGTDTINRHPVNRLYAEQTLSLSGGVMGDSDSYSIAYAQCERLAHGPAGDATAVPESGPACADRAGETAQTKVLAERGNQ